jgi:hypothetical protein
MPVMRRRLWAAWAFIALAGAQMYTLLSSGNSAFPFCGTLAMGALTAYAILGNRTWSDLQRWTVAGLTVLTGAVGAIEFSELTHPWRVLPWLIECVVCAGALAIGRPAAPRLLTAAGLGLIPLGSLLLGSLLTIGTSQFLGDHVPPSTASTSSPRYPMWTSSSTAAYPRACSSLPADNYCLSAASSLEEWLSCDCLPFSSTTVEVNAHATASWRATVVADLTVEDAAPTGGDVPATTVAPLLIGLLAFVTAIFPPTDEMGLHSRRAGG